MPVNDDEHSPPSDDDRYPEIAATIGREHPRWVVLWGPYSREFWAYPCLPVPRGTIVHAGDPDMLVAGMSDVELMAAQPPGFGLSGAAVRRAAEPPQ